MVAIPDPALVILVGPSGSGKSRWAAEHFAANQIVSSDALRAAVGRDECDLEASETAFRLLESIVSARTERRLTTVVDTLGFDATLREWLRRTADTNSLPVHVVVMDTPAALCRTRNAEREKRVPVAVLTAQLKRFQSVRDELASEPCAGTHVIVARGTAHASGSGSPDRGADATSAPTLGDGAPRDGRMRFGLQISSFPWPAAEHSARLTEIAQAAEAAGFDSLWVMDHFRQIPQLGREWDDMYESTTTLAHLAAVTKRVTVGPLVASVTHRNLAVFGKAIATLDVLSGGRAACGLGLGWFAAEHAAYGIDLPTVRERYELLEDALRFLPMLWGKGAPSFAGKRFSAESAICYPRPLQARIPLVVGGSGERRTLKLAAQYADACNLFGEPEVVARKVAALHRWCDELGRDRSEVAVTHLGTVIVGRNAKDLAAAISQAKAPPKTLASQHPGTVVDHVARVAALRSAGVQHVVVSMPMISADALATFGDVITASS